jgi:glycosyltransferase involved in cell wall biosynthesis
MDTSLFACAQETADESARFLSVGKSCPKDTETAHKRTLVVIPAYNEQDALPQTIDSLQSLPANFELLVVNDGSTDDTALVASRLSTVSLPSLHVISLPLNGGIGIAVQTGYLFAVQQQRFDYVIQFDGDGQHDTNAIGQLVDTCERYDLDLCIGSRFLPESLPGFRSTWLRRFGIRFLAWLISLLGGARVTDPTSGLRCAGRRAWTIFATQYPDDYPEPESLFWCIRNRLRVGEIPAVMHERFTGASSIHTLRGAYYMLKVTLAILVDRLRPRECAAG